MSTWLQLVKMNLFLKTWSWRHVPMLHKIGAKIITIDDTTATVMVPFKRTNRNHLNSLYMAVLVAGADVASGFFAMKLIKDSGQNVSLIFKDLNAKFYKRAEGDTFFTCNDGAAIKDLVTKALKQKERIETSVFVSAYCPNKLGKTPVAQFTMTLSIKKL